MPILKSRAARGSRSIPLVGADRACPDSHWASFCAALLPRKTRHGSYPGSHWLRFAASRAKTPAGSIGLGFPLASFGNRRSVARLPSGFAHLHIGFAQRRPGISFSRGWSLPILEIGFVWRRDVGRRGTSKNPHLDIGFVRRGRISIVISPGRSTLHRSGEASRRARFDKLPKNRNGPGARPRRPGPRRAWNSDAEGRDRGRTASGIEGTERRHQDRETPTRRPR